MAIKVSFSTRSPTPSPFGWPFSICAAESPHEWNMGLWPVRPAELHSAETAKADSMSAGRTDWKSIFRRAEERDVSTTIIRNGRVIDPANRRDEVVDLVIVDGRIADLSAIRNPQSAIAEIDATDLIVVPGLIDIHVHLREPGFGWKETIESGARAAAAGGFATVVCMPNTSPVADTPSTITWIKDRAREVACVNVLHAAAIPKNIARQALAPLDSLV